MKKTLLKLCSCLGKSFVHCFALLALFAAYSNRYRCLFFLGEAKKTANVTPDNIKALWDKEN